MSSSRPLYPRLRDLAQIDRIAVRFREKVALDAFDRASQLLRLWRGEPVVVLDFAQETEHGKGSYQLGHMKPPDRQTLGERAKFPNRGRHNRERQKAPTDPPEPGITRLAVLCLERDLGPDLRQVRVHIALIDELGSIDCRFGESERRGRFLLALGCAEADKPGALRVNQRRVAVGIEPRDRNAPGRRPFRLETQRDRVQRCFPGRVPDRVRSP